MNDEIDAVTALPECVVGGSNPRLPGEPGIWILVAGDLAVFSVFFVLIALGNSHQPEVFADSRARLDVLAGTANTLLLLTGSWGVATGVNRCHRPCGARAGGYFLLAILCGLVFVANKAFEWRTKLAEGLTPATNDFFMYYFVLTGIHLLHVVIGIGVLVLVRRISQRPNLGVRAICAIESGATFWHLVDLLWIVLFALLYLL
jgi:nitric oxide reductase NorE protein